MVSKKPIDLVNSGFDGCQNNSLKPSLERKPFYEKAQDKCLIFHKPMKTTNVRLKKNCYHKTGILKYAAAALHRENLAANGAQ